MGAFDFWPGAGVSLNIAVLCLPVMMVPLVVLVWGFNNWLEVRMIGVMAVAVAVVVVAFCLS